MAEVVIVSAGDNESKYFRECCTGALQRLWSAHEAKSNPDENDQQLTSLIREHDLVPAQDRIQTCNDLAATLWSRWNERQDEMALAASVEVLGELLDMTPPDHPDRAPRCTTLAVFLRTYFDRTGDRKLLYSAIELSREALALRPEGHAERIQSCVSLYTSLRKGLEVTKDPALLDEEISLSRWSMYLLPPEHPRRLTWCMNLALSLKDRYDQTGDDDLLGEAIERHREVLTLPSIGPAEQAQTCGMLAGCLYARFKKTQDRALLEDAIVRFREAIGMLDPSHPNRAVWNSNITLALKDYHDLTGDVTVLDEAVRCYQEVLAAGPEDPVIPYEGIADCFHRRFKRTGEDAQLDASIQLRREVLNVRPAAHPGRATAALNLADSLRSRFLQTGDLAILDEMTTLEREALRLWPASFSDPGRPYMNLANSLKDRYDQTRDATLLEEAIGLDRKALDLHPTGHSLRVTSCNNLSASLQKMYTHTGDTAFLDEATTLLQEALDSSFTGHPDRALICENMAMFLTIKSDLTGDQVPLDKAIARHREALELLPAGHVQRPDAQEHLSNCLRKRYGNTGEAALLDEAISALRESLSLRPSSHPVRAAACLSLAKVLRLKSNLTGDSALFDEAIALQREALVLRPVGHPERMFACGNLAISLESRFSQTGDLALLTEAIELQREALRLSPTRNLDRAAICTQLATFLATLHSRKQDDAILDEAMQLQQEALSLQPENHPDRAETYLVLAHLTLQRSEEPEKSALLDESIAFSREAVRLWPAGNPNHPAGCIGLAVGLRARARNSSGEEQKASREEMRSLLQETLAICPPGHRQRWRCLLMLTQDAFQFGDWTAGMRLLGEAIESPTYYSMDLFLTYVVNILDSIDLSVLFPKHIHDLLGQYERALSLLTLATGLALDTSTQLQHISVASTLGSGAFMSAMRVSELAVGLRLLEQARGVIWSQTLRLRDPDLSRAPPELSVQLEDLIRSMRTARSSRSEEVSAGPVSTVQERDLRYSQHTQLQRLLRNIRSRPGLQDFMSGPSADALLSVASRSSVVVLVSGVIGDRRECHALIIVAPNVPLIDVPLDGIDEEALHGLTLSGLQKRGSLLDDANERGMRVAKGSSPSHARLATLWRTVVKPVITQLGLEKSQGRARPRIHWCPTGAFAFVPVHAAGIYEGGSRECCADYVVSSYTPTLTALLRAQQTAPTFAPQEVSLLTVAVENSPGMPRLPCVAEEARVIAQITNARSVSCGSGGDTMSKAELVTSLESANMVHLACHGIQHRAEPHKSHFCLGSGELTVSELMEVDLKNSFFAFLSACETAKGDQKHADEVVHLAATMLFTGFKSVVATMWAMSDADGPYIARRFYESLFAIGTIDIDTIPYALDDAVSALRASGASPERWATFIHMGA